MMIWDFMQKLLLAVKKTPFRAIEFMVSPVLLWYGIFLVFATEGSKVSAFYSSLYNPKVALLTSGMAYMVTGAYMLYTAGSGCYFKRRAAALVLFFTLLYAMILRILEQGFTLSSLIFIWIGLVTAMVDAIQLSGRAKE